ncbi:MAG: tetrahydrofolate dehydrogenase/cyclohydrolase catalytic domain-containing protein [bacterium]
MRIQFLDAKSIISSRERALKRELASIQKEHKILPKLAILLVTGDQIVMAQTEKVIRLAESTGFEIKLDQIAERNVNRNFADKLSNLADDDSFTGIWVATPRFDFPPYDLITEILPHTKDLSGCHYYTFGRYMFGKPTVVPPKVRAVHDLLEEYVDGYKEKGIIIISTKNDGTRGFFGKYLAGYLYDHGARVSIRNIFSSTKDQNRIMELYNPFGEVVITALNTSGAVGGDHLKKGSFIIDTGYNFHRNKISGDVDLTSVQNTCHAITPVPGGVDSLIPVEIISNALDLVKVKVGVPMFKTEVRGIRGRR